MVEPRGSRCRDTQGREFRCKSNCARLDQDSSGILIQPVKAAVKDTARSN